MKKEDWSKKEFRNDQIKRQKKVTKDAPRDHLGRWIKKNARR